MNKIATFTIIANNYLSYARTLMQSLETHNPSWDRYLILVDSVNNSTAMNENFTIINVDELNIPDLKGFLARYDILESSTAVKPWAFQKLFDNGYKNVIYFDPDIEIYKDLSEMEKYLKNNLMLLTPHILETIIDEDFTDLDIVKAGSYNLGFLALCLHTELNKFLNWWKSKLEFYCINNAKEGYFVDQKWMELCPSLFNGVVILKDKGYNIAYWNVVERDPIDISFFHFSGIDMNTPEILSKYRKKLLLSHCSEKVRLITESYRSKLISNGYELSSKIECTSKKIINRNNYSGIYDNDTYRLHDKYVWMDKKASFNLSIEAGSLTFYFLCISEYYSVSPTISIHIDGDLISQETIKNGECTITVPISRKTVSNIEVECSSSFVPSEIGIGSDIRILSIGIWKIMSNNNIVINFERRVYKDKYLNKGFNLIGNLESETGVGQVVRYISKSMKKCGIKHSVINWSNNNSKNVDSSLLSDISDKIYNINIFFINGEYKLDLLFDRSLFKDSYNIGYWCWETSNIPDIWYDNENILDEIWTLSNFCQQAISMKSTLPVIRVVPPIDFTVVGNFNKVKYGIPEDKFKFLFIYDSFSCKERKNPEGLIKSFLLAKEDVSFNNTVLIIKTNSDELNQYKSDDIIIINEVMSRQDIYELHNACNCFVSLHRAEGLGLNLMEAMYLGKPVIATGWSGNLDFMNEGNSYLVKYKLKTIKNGFGPYKAGEILAEPDLPHAAELMIQVANNPNVKVNNFTNINVRDIYEKRLNTITPSIKFRNIT